MIRRIFVEKKPGFDVEAQNLAAELENVRSLRLLNVYDIEGIGDDAAFSDAVKYVFSEPMCDTVYYENFSARGREQVFVAAYLPGQYDQRADSAEQCLKLLGIDARVASAKVYAADCDDIGSVKNYLINPVDSREISIFDKPKTLSPQYAEPPDVAVLDFSDLPKTHREMGLAMSLADLELIRDFFGGRQITETELRVLDTYWSDHCRHTTFSAEITDIFIEKGKYSAPIERALAAYRAEDSITLMKIATAGMKKLRAAGKLDDLDVSDEINACSINVDVKIGGETVPYLVMFKNETHNHPTEIEPFGGAATCLGGAIRDPLSGRSYVYQALRVTGAADPRVTETLAGKLPQRSITRRAAAGFSSYGNQIGLATGLVDEIYDAGYAAKRMEIGAVVGAAPKAHILRETPEAGDLVLLIGGRTGRDGCGGATGSSKAHTADSILTCGAEVQKGNPVTERKLQRLFRNPEFTRKVRRCNDFGAGGVSVAVGELADGLDIDLDAVPKKYEGLNGTELAISESQERMAVVVRERDAEAVKALCAEENLEATVVAAVRSDRVLHMKWRGKTIVELPRELMDTNGAKQFAAAKIAAPDEKNTPFTPKYSKIRDVLSDLNVCSKRGLSERFDSTIGAGSVTMPYGGRYQLTPTQVSACKIPVFADAEDCDSATLMSYAYDPEIAKWSMFHGAAFAVADSLSKIAAAGGDASKARLTLQEYFEKPGDDPSRWGKPLAALLGAYSAQIASGSAAIGGKDSMSGSFGDLDVPPTVVCFALSVADADAVISPEFKAAGHSVVLADVPLTDELLPDFDAMADMHNALRTLKIYAAHALSRFGLAEALPIMAFGNKIGVRMTADLDIFAPRNTAILLEVDKNAELPDGFAVIGETVAEKTVLGEDLDELIGVWERPLSAIFPTRDERVLPFESVAPQVKPFDAPRVGISREPRVVIPVFPGTNCEYDSRRAFARAGADVVSPVFGNLDKYKISASIDALERELSNAEILMLAGGFSAGDEPDGSAKFITAVLRNEKIREAAHKLLDRGGLILGICNGFQALIKLGLLTSGRVSDVGGDSPTLTFNSVGRHISRIARTRIVSANSPWLTGVNVGDTHCVPISHGEGRFAADEKTVRDLFARGLVAAVYDGENPNGSAAGIEGIISPCGRILGKMGHSERFSRNTYRNIDGNFDQKLFESAVKYFNG